MNSQDVDKLRNYINGSLKDYVEKKENRNLEIISVTFDSQNSQLLLDGGEYLQVLRSKYMNIIRDVINKIYQSKGKSINIVESSPLLLKLDETPIVSVQSLLFQNIPIQNIPVQPAPILPVPSQSVSTQSVPVQQRQAAPSQPIPVQSTPVQEVQSVEIKPKRGRPKKQEINLRTIVKIGELYFNLIPQDLLLEILKQSLGYTYYDKFIENTEGIFGELLKDEGINQLLFYHLVPYYSHVKRITSEMHNWMHAFEIAYRNTFPPKPEDTKMIVRGKEIIRPIENAFVSTPDTFRRIKNVKNDNKGLPISFHIEFYDTHNDQRGDEYFRVYNYMGLGYTEYERKATKWYYKKYNDQKFQLLEIRGSFDIITTKRDTLLYYYSYPKLLIPWVGITFTYHPGLGAFYLFKVINIEWGEEIPIKLDAIYVGNKELNVKKLTIIPVKNREGYTSIEITSLQDGSIYNPDYISWNAKTEKEFTYDDY